MSIFDQQREFMRACGQTAWAKNVEQARLYDVLVTEEFQEWIEAESGSADDLDAVVDLLVTLIGYGLSQGWDLNGAWDEVMRSNMAKIDPKTGKVNRREDGKILKPAGWVPPSLEKFLSRGSRR